MRPLLTTSYAVAEAHRPRLALVEAKTEPPPAHWYAVTSYGVYYADLTEEERAEIRAQYPGAIVAVLAAVQWRRR